MKAEHLAILATVVSAVGLALSLVSMLSPDGPTPREAAALLQWHGYSNPVLLPGRLNLPCDGRRRPRARFTATDADGQPVRGYLCCAPRVGCEVEIVP